MTIEWLSQIMRRYGWVAFAAALALTLGALMRAPLALAAPNAQEAPTPDPFLETPTPDPFFMTPTPDPFLDPSQLPPPVAPDTESIPSAAPPLPAPSGELTSTAPVEAPTEAPPIAADVTVEQLRNAAVIVPSMGVSGTVQLVDGRFDNPQTGLSIVLVDSLVALGDVTADGGADAAIVLQSTGGADGPTTDVVVLTSQGDIPVALAGKSLGNAVVDAIRIDKGAVWVDLRAQGPNDDPCCPTLALKRILVPRNGQLTELPAAASGRLFPYRYGPLYGYVNVLGEFVVPPQFAFAGDFVEGLALVSSDGRNYGFINRLGQYVIPAQYQFATPFDGGVAVAGLSSSTTGAEDQALYIDRSGNNIFGDLTFAAAQPFSEGMAAVKSAEGQFGYIDRTGNLAIPAAFDFALPFAEGLAPVIVGDKVGYVDRRGVVVIDPQFDAGDVFSEGMAAVALSGTVGYVNHAGEFSIEPQFERAERFVNGLAPAVLDGREVYIDNSGAAAISEPLFSGAQRFSEGRAAVQVDGLYGYLDPRGALAIAPQFTSAGPFQNGLAVVEAAQTWGVIAHDGTWLVQLSLMPRPDVITGTIPSAAALGAPGTQVVTFIPPVPDEIRAGACYTGSDIVPLATAWRCGVGSEVFDPCVMAADGVTVVCNVDPAADQPGFALELSQPLPAAGIEGKTWPGAWLFQLENGEICRYNMGASVTIGDERINYSCSNLTQLIGEIDKSTPLWTIASITTEGDGAGGLVETSRTPVTIVRTWMPGLVGP